MPCSVIAETKLRDENLHHPNNARDLGLRRGGLVGAARTLQGRGPETLGACEYAGGKRWEPGRAPPCPASAGRQGASAVARAQTPEEPGHAAGRPRVPPPWGREVAPVGLGAASRGSAQDVGSLSALGALWSWGSHSSRGRSGQGGPSADSEAPWGPAAEVLGGLLVTVRL